MPSAPVLPSHHLLHQSMSSANHGITATKDISHSPAMDAFLAPFIKAARGKRPGRRSKGQADGSSVVVSIFDVPPGLLALARPQDGALPPPVGQMAAEGSMTASTEARSDGAIAPADARGLTCNRCGLKFGDDRAMQVQHFKSDLHMANLRRQLAGKPRISQAQLDDETAAAEAAAAAGNGGMGSAAAAAEVEPSSSGTDSDEGPGPVGTTERGLDLDGVEEEEEDAGDGGLLSAVGEAGGAENGGHERGRVKVDFSLQEGPRLTFVPQGSAWAFSLSSAALGMERGDDPWARLDSLVGTEGENRLWAVVILRSGKFAAAVFEGQSVVCHKVFRRCEKDSCSSKEVALDTTPPLPGPDCIARLLHDERGSQLSNEYVALDEAISSPPFAALPLFFLQNNGAVKIEFTWYGILCFQYSVGQF